MPSPPKLRAKDASHLSRELDEVRRREEELRKLEEEMKKRVEELQRKLEAERELVGSHSVQCVKLTTKLALIRNAVKMWPEIVTGLTPSHNP